MSAIMEGVSLLLHKVEVCEPRNATASPPVTSPTQAPKPRPPVNGEYIILAVEYGS